MSPDSGDLQTVHLARLRDALRSAAVAPFVGGDLPEAVTGVPSRAELARWMAEQRGLPTGLSLAQVTRRLSTQGSRFDFTALLRQRLDTADKAPQRFHRLLAGLIAAYRLRTVVLTAYDTLLEAALREAGVGFNRVVTTADVGFLRPDRPTLVYLYGLAERPETLVVTEDDHYALHRDRDKEGVLDEVRQAFSRNLVLFLGYDLADPDFRLLWHDTLGRMGRMAVGALATAPDLPAEEARLWAERQVTVLDLEPTALLALLAEAPAARDHRPAAAEPGDAGQDETASEAERLRLRRQLDVQRRKLALLEEQRSYYTAATAPVTLLLEIQDTQREIERLEEELDRLDLP
ncbi:MAG: SIR2 family protein [Anaerolineae bacterium]|nr:SIR2 family protein [Anaerolineae bacterium]